MRAASGNGGTDTLTGFDRAYGGLGNDTIRGTNGDDTLGGDYGADRIDGRGGNDIVDYSVFSTCPITAGVFVNLSTPARRTTDPLAAAGYDGDPGRGHRGFLGLHRRLRQ